MRKPTVGAFETKLWQCTRILNAQQAVETVVAIGGEFIAWSDTGYRRGIDPLARPRNDGSFGGSRIADFHHPALQMDFKSERWIRLGANNVPADAPAWAYMRFTDEARVMTICQDASLEDQLMVDRLALGQLRLACELCPLCEPTYGWIDERGDNQPTWVIDDPSPDDLEFLFWATVFGPSLVKCLGRRFLLNAPGWHIEDLPYGAVLYIATESYLDWYHNEQNDALTYFRERMPNIQLYRAEDRGF